MYRIEIWIWHELVDVYSSDNPYEVLLWYRGKWAKYVEKDGYYFYLFKNNIPIYKETKELGFYD